MPSNGKDYKNLVYNILPWLMPPISSIIFLQDKRPTHHVTPKHFGVPSTVFLKPVNAFELVTQLQQLRQDFCHYNSDTLHKCIICEHHMR